jgi:hypothetical protein
VPRPEPSTGGRSPWRASYKLPERGPLGRDCPPTWDNQEMDETPPQRRRQRHPPNELPPWVFFQHQVWVDRSAVEHEIESMPLHNV